MTLNTFARIDLQSDTVLVAALLERNPSAWREFDARFRALVLGRIRRTLSRSGQMNLADEQEVAGEFFAGLLANDFRKLRGFDASRGCLGAWLSTIATNATLDFLRAARRRPAGSSALEQLTDDSESPASELERSDAVDRLVEMVTALSARDQDFVQLYYVDGLSPEGVASAMGVSINTVYSKKNKIRARLEQLV